MHFNKISSNHFDTLNCYIYEESTDFFRTIHPFNYYFLNKHGLFDEFSVFLRKDINKDFVFSIDSFSISKFKSYDLFDSLLNLDIPFQSKGDYLFFANLSIKIMDCFEFSSVHSLEELEELYLYESSNGDLPNAILDIVFFEVFNCLIKNRTEFRLIIVSNSLLYSNLYHFFKNRS